MSTQTKCCGFFSKMNTKPFFLVRQSCHSYHKLDVHQILKSYFCDRQNEMMNYFQEQNYKISRKVTIKTP